MVVEKIGVIPFSDDGQENLIAVGLLIILGLGLLAHPLYLWPHYGQSAFVMDVEELSSTPDEFIHYNTLPGESQAIFQEAVTDGQQTLWSGEDEGAIENFEGGPAIQYEGDYYRVQFGHIDAGGGFVQIIFRWFLTAVSAFLIAFGGLVLYTGSWQPLTPTRSLWVPIAVTIGFYVTNAYDVSYSGVEGSIWSIAGIALIGLIPITVLFTVVGSEVAISGWESRIALGGSAAIFLIAAILFGSISIIILILVLYTAIGGAPWFWLGHKLTRPV